MYGDPMMGMGMGGQQRCFKCKGSGRAYGLVQCRACKGTGFIPATYRPCPRCGGEGKGVLRDCRLCDDLCYVTEPWVQCQVCFGRGRQGHTELSPDCYACRGVGFVKPGFGVGGPAYGTYGASAAPGMVPPMYPPAVQPPMGGFGPAPYGGAYPPAYF